MLEVVLLYKLLCCVKSLQTVVMKNSLNGRSTSTYLVPDASSSFTSSFVVVFWVQLNCWDHFLNDAVSPKMVFFLHTFVCTGFFCANTICIHFLEFSRLIIYVLTLWNSTVVK